MPLFQNRGLHAPLPFEHDRRREEPERWKEKGWGQKQCRLGEAGILAATWLEQTFRSLANDHNFASGREEAIQLGFIWWKYVHPFLTVGSLEKCLSFLFLSAPPLCFLPAAKPLKKHRNIFQKI